MRLTRFEIVRKLNGDARGLSHCLSHLTNDRGSPDYWYENDRAPFYVEKARELSAKIRGLQHQAQAFRLPDDASNAL
jgi:hypothetical protein